MHEPRKALWLRNIAAHWRARAATSQNPEARSRLYASAAHYEELARELGGEQTPPRYAFAYAPKQRLILISAGKVLNEEIYLDAYEAIVRFIASSGPSSLILDLSAVEELNVSAKFALRIGRRKAAIPARMSRFVVAPQQKVYEFCRSVEALRASTAAPISVVREIGVAFARFGVSRADFCQA